MITPSRLTQGLKQGFGARRQRAARTEPAVPDAITSPGVARQFAPPSARRLRAQAVQRLQIGLFGLALMLLLRAAISQRS